MLERQLLVPGAIGMIVFFRREVVGIEEVQEVQLFADRGHFRPVLRKMLPQLTDAGQLTSIQLREKPEQEEVGSKRENW